MHLFLPRPPETPAWCDITDWYERATWLCYPQRRLEQVIHLCPLHQQQAEEEDVDD